MAVADPGFFLGGGADQTEPYRKNPKQNPLSDSFVPFLNFKLKRPQRGGWLATQTTPSGSAPEMEEVIQHARAHSSAAVRKELSVSKLHNITFSLHLYEFSISQIKKNNINGRKF